MTEATTENETENEAWRIKEFVDKDSAVEWIEENIGLYEFRTEDPVYSADKGTWDVEYRPLFPSNESPDSHKSGHEWIVWDESGIKTRGPSYSQAKSDIIEMMGRPLTFKQIKPGSHY
ncbi:MAG: hypothetical protein ACE5IJ_12060, partial [Thermoplasmata archaeon]